MAGMQGRETSLPTHWVAGWEQARQKVMPNRMGEETEAKQVEDHRDGAWRVTNGQRINEYIREKVV